MGLIGWRPKRVMGGQVLSQLVPHPTLNSCRGDAAAVGQFRFRQISGGVGMPQVLRPVPVAGSNRVQLTALQTHSQNIPVSRSIPMPLL